MTDERALDLGFQALDRAMSDGQDELAAFRKGIEAYEAAKWRSIEEAPRDGREILAQLGWPNESHTQMIVLYFANGRWFDGSNNAPPADELVGAMFSTIDPPPQK